jgi:hypothetical protein
MSVRRHAGAIAAVVGLAAGLGACGNTETSATKPTKDLEVGRSASAMPRRAPRFRA